MTKKMMKRSLALGALMAFVITGSAMAAENYNNNRVDIKDPTLDHHVYGAYADNNYTGGLTGNIVNIENTTIDVKNNNNKQVAAYVAGAWYSSNGEGDLTNNKVVLTGVKDSSNSANYTVVYGAINIKGSGDIIGNTVTLKDCEVNDVAAGQHQGSGGSIKNNKIVAENTTSKNALYGAGVYNGNFEDVSGNTVELKGNTVVARAYGVRFTDTAKNNPAATVAKLYDNSVILADGANVIGEISAYHIREDVGSSIDNTYNNSLIINDGWTGAGNGTETGISENTLNNVQNFDIIDIGWSEGKELTIKNLTANVLDGASGENEALTFKLNNIETKVKVESFTNADQEVVTVEGTSKVTDQLDGNNLEDSLVAIANDNFEGVNNITNVNSATGTILGASSLDVKYDETTSMYVANGDLKQEANSSNASVNDMTALALMSWRAETNDMNKRMGELRNANGEHGVWVRMVRGEDEYGSVKNQYNQYQLGYDEKLSVDKRWTVGAALSYTDAENSFVNGNGESTNKALSIYGSKLNDDGSFIDLIAKYGRLENDFKLAGGIGDADYSTNAYSISAEFGKRIEQGKGLWIEPQVELTYGKVSNVTYTAASGATVAQDGMESIVGRIGFSLGKDIKQGNVYARASYLYDFDGETKATMSYQGNSANFENDLGGGWWEVGVGTNINLSDATYIYADVEKTFGGEVDTNWQWNLGVRYSF